MDPYTFTLLSLDEFLKKQTLVDSFVRLFIEVYKEAWNEDWTSKEVIKTLHPRTGYAESWMCLMFHQDTLCGFAYASVVRLKNVREIPKSFSGGKEEKIALVRATQQAVRTHLSVKADSPLLHFKEFAIAKRHRIEVPHKLRGLVYPILCQAAHQEIEKGVIRTSRKSPMYTLAQNLLACQKIFLYPDHENVLMAGTVAAACARLNHSI
jgi:hypothetical protein